MKVKDNIDLMHAEAREIGWTEKKWNDEEVKAANTLRSVGFRDRWEVMAVAHQHGSIVG